MPAIYSPPNYPFLDSDEDQTHEPEGPEVIQPTLSQMAFWYTMLLVIMLVTWFIVYFCLRILSMRQKTRNPQERRPYAGSRARPSFAQPDPIIYVSPANLPPPPKYEAMAPPSYDEVVGVHYPATFQSLPPQPITQPITHAMAQGSTSNVTNNATSNVTDASAPAVVSVISEQRRTSVPVTAAS